MAKKKEAKGRKKKGKGMKSYQVDFSGVSSEIRKRGRRIPEGDYVGKVTNCERRKNKAGDAYFFNWTIQVVEDVKGNKKYAGVPLYFTTSLKPEALFNLRNLINAATGKNVAGKSLNFDPKKLYGKKIGMTVEDDEYESDGKSKVKSGIADVMPVSELLEDEDEEEEDDDDDEDDEDDEDDDDEDEEDDEDDDEDDEDDDEDDDDLDDVDVDDDL